VKRGNIDVHLVTLSKLAILADRTCELSVNAKPVIEVYGLAIATELLNRLDKAVKSAAHIVELTTDVPGVKRVLHDLIEIHRLAIGDYWAE
jgi:hypothetical protein